MGEGWVVWRGGTCPVHPSAQVEVLFRHKVKGRHNRSVGPADKYSWTHASEIHAGTESGGDIVFFRVVGPKIDVDESPEPSIPPHAARTHNGAG